MAKLTNAQQEAIETLTDICERADAMGLGMVKFFVSDVREALAAIRRLAITEASSALSEGGGNV